jgi:hypothetical protein
MDYRNRMRVRLAQRQIEQARQILRNAADELFLTEDSECVAAAGLLLDQERQIGNLQNNEVPEGM